LKGTDRYASNVGKIIFQEAKKITGTRYFTPAQLARMDHPYSTRHPKGFAGQDDRLISKQTGALYRSLRRTTIKRKGKTTLVIWAGAPQAGALTTGTPKMRERNFLQLAYERSRKRLTEAQDKFLEEVGGLNVAR